MHEYQTVTQDQGVARLVAAVLVKLGESVITISYHDLVNLPEGHIESTGDPFGPEGCVTYRIKRYQGGAGQGSLFDEPVPPLPPLTEDPMPQTRVAEPDMTSRDYFLDGRDRYRDLA